MEYTKIKNTQGISEIIMKPWTIFKCQIGQDWFKNDLEIHFTPGEYYPDYMHVVEYIMKEIDGQEMNIEDMLEKLYNFLKTTYEPKHLKIVDNVFDSKTHFDVTVVEE